MKIINFILLASFLLLGCGQKSNQIQDTPPQFRFDSDEINLQNEEIPMKRTDTGQGPEIILQSNDGQEIDRVEKKIVCKSQTLKGRTFKAPDTRLLQFNISESEFNGLRQLPQNPSCELVATLYNKNGSSRTIKKLIHFLFDTPPSLPIKRLTLAGGSIISENIPNFVADRYQITNTFNYPVGFNYTPKLNPKMRAAYDTNKGVLFYSSDEFLLHIDRLDISSNAKEIVRFNSSEISFVVPPGQTVTLTAWGTIPGQFISSTENKKLVGPYVTDINVPQLTSGLMMWPDYNNPNEWREQWRALITETTVAPSTHMDPHFYVRILMQ